MLTLSQYDLSHMLTVLNHTFLEINLGKANAIGCNGYFQSMTSK